jgi:hypothetical protein
VTEAEARADPDDIGPDGRVRLRAHLPSANSLWFFAGCQGPTGCGHVAPIGVRAALRIMGSGEATVGELGRRLRCSRCGNRQVSIVLQPDTRPPAVRESDGPAAGNTGRDARLGRRRWWDGCGAKVRTRAMCA